MLYKALCSFLCLFLLLENGIAKEDKSSISFKRQREYCALMTQCHIEVPEYYCPDSKPKLRKKISGVEYNTNLCGESLSLIEKGISHTDWTGRKLYSFLGSKHRVSYTVESDLPISIEAFRYLLDDIPFAAKIVNAFRHTHYEVHYLPGTQKRHWKGHDGKKLRGEAKLVAGDPHKDSLTYFGKGVVKLWKWNLHGPVLFEVTYAPSSKDPQNSIQYQLNIITFPGNSFVNAVMNMGYIERTVKKKIHGVFEDITFSANALERLSYSKLLKKYDWEKEDKPKLQHLKDM